MKSLCAFGLMLIVGLGWAASRANAQSGSAVPSLLPLPRVTPVESTPILAGYYSNSPVLAAPSTSTYVNPYAESMFARRQETAIEPAPPAEKTEFEKSIEDTCWGDSCSPCSGSWFGTFGGVVLTRSRGPSTVTTYQATTNEPLMTMQDASAGWTGGGELTFGYAFGGAANVGPWGASGACCGPAVAFTWWGTGEMNGFSQVNDPNDQLNASISFLGVTINGAPTSDFFDAASSQRLFRTDIANNFEANLLSGTLISTAKIQVIGLVGFRYFRFSETLTFGSLAGSADEDWGSNGGADAAYLTFRSVNSLYGVQLGSIFNYQFAPQWSLYFVPKAGIYGNQMSLRTRLYLGDGFTELDFSDNKTDVAFLGQIDTGLTCQLWSNWTGYVGYRVIGLSNLALGDGQFSPSFGDLKQGGGLIVHGTTFGLAWSY